MFLIHCKRQRLLCTVVLAVVLTGCVLAQKVSEGTKSMASAVFYKQNPYPASRLCFPQRPEYRYAGHAACHDGAYLATENPRKFRQSRL